MLLCFAEILSDPTVTSRLSDTKVNHRSSGLPISVIIDRSGYLEKLLMFRLYATCRQQERWKPWKISTRCSSMSLTELSMGEWWRKQSVTHRSVFFHPLNSNNATTFVSLHPRRLAHVEKAAEALAIDTLLISDKLFRYVLRWDWDIPDRYC